MQPRATIQFKLFHVKSLDGLNYVKAEKSFRSVHSFNPTQKQGSYFEKGFWSQSNRLRSSNRVPHKPTVVRYWSKTNSYFTVPKPFQTNARSE